MSPFRSPIFFLSTVFPDTWNQRFPSKKESTFYTQTKQMSKLLLSISSSSALLKGDTMMIVFELNDDKYIQTLFFPIFHNEPPLIFVNIFSQTCF
jgi:hypothetical protein